MSTIAALSDVVFSAEDFTMESAAMEAITLNHLTRRQVNGIDRALTYAGLESATSMAVSISQEGLIDWVKNKLSVIGRKINIAVNKVYAFVTRADENTKELIRRAEKDDSVALPISGKQATAILGAATAVVGGIAWYATKGTKEGADKGESVYKKVTGKISEMYTANKDVRAGKKRIVAHKQALRDNAKAIRETPGWDKNRAELIKNHKAQGDWYAADKDALKGAKAKTFLSQFRGLMSKIGAAIKNFFTSFRSAESVAASEAKKAAGDKSGIWNRIKGLGSSVKNVFKLVWKFFAKLPKRFKSKS